MNQCIRVGEVVAAMGIIWGHGWNSPQYGRLLKLSWWVRKFKTSGPMTGISFFCSKFWSRKVYKGGDHVDSTSWRHIHAVVILVHLFFSPKFMITWLQISQKCDFGPFEHLKMYIRILWDHVICQLFEFWLLVHLQLFEWIKSAYTRRFKVDQNSFKLSTRFCSLKVFF